MNSTISKLGPLSDSIRRFAEDRMNDNSNTSFDPSVLDKDAEIAALSRRVKELLNAVKMAYRKHHLSDPSIGWEYLSDILLNALCNAMGDEEYNKWLREYNKWLREVNK